MAQSIKNLLAMQKTEVLSLGSGRSPGKGNGSPLQYFGHLMRRVDSLEKTLMLGGIGAGGEGDNRG